MFIPFFEVDIHNYEANFLAVGDTQEYHKLPRIDIQAQEEPN